ncbi:DUF397 domain-containing protein [Actinomadura sp. GC306]|uniref:DUF397 domain-containing protein n=1 Tax=Actinomadura sp. GC306 TaxID=2530367 RepID=UPI00104D4ADD|nr:DUF397 domain-containing protein [Actinomadura sp. GC306]TDC63120.1 DUF397 domain-containing protein [Actinomadura sp. GC306]
MDLITATWRKSSHSGSTGGECVELAALPEGVGIRDSKNPDGPKLLLGRDEFAALVGVLKY